MNHTRNVSGSHSSHSAYSSNLTQRATPWQGAHDPGVAGFAQGAMPAATPMPFGFFPGQAGYNSHDMVVPAWQHRWESGAATAPAFANTQPAGLGPSANPYPNHMPNPANFMLPAGPAATAAHGFEQRDAWSTTPRLRDQEEIDYVRLKLATMRSLGIEPGFITPNALAPVYDMLRQTQALPAPHDGQDPEPLFCSVMQNLAFAMVGRPACVGKVIGEVAFKSVMADAQNRGLPKHGLDAAGTFLSCARSSNEDMLADLVSLSQYVRGVLRPEEVAYIFYITTDIASRPMPLAPWHAVHPRLTRFFTPEQIMAIRSFHDAVTDNQEARRAVLRQARQLDGAVAKERIELNALYSDQTTILNVIGGDLRRMQKRIMRSTDWTDATAVSSAYGQEESELQAMQAQLAANQLNINDKAKQFWTMQQVQADATDAAYSVPFRNFGVNTQFMWQR